MAGQKHFACVSANAARDRGTADKRCGQEFPLASRDESPLLSAHVAFERVTGRRPSKALIYRWGRKGKAGVRLFVRLSGREILTTEVAVRQFLESVADVTASA
jgi:hypothetical protein